MAEGTRGSGVPAPVSGIPRQENEHPADILLTRVSFGRLGECVCLGLASSLVPVPLLGTVWRTLQPVNTAL